MGEGEGLNGSRAIDWKALTDCRYFLQNSCRLTAEACPYRHCQELLSPAASPRICRKWDQYQCHDRSCPFLHPSSLSEYQQAQRKKSSSEVRPSQPLGRGGTVAVSTTGVAAATAYCVYFMRGKCTKGDQCPYLHERDELTREGRSGPGAGDSSGGERENLDLKRKAESILTKHSFKKSLTSSVPPSRSRRLVTVPVSGEAEGGEESRDSATNEGR
jgi:hypothetical protein